MAWEYGTRPRGSTPPDYTLAHYTRTSSFASPAYVPVQDPFDYTLFRRTFSSSSSDPSFRRVFTNSAYVRIYSSYFFRLSHILIHLSIAKPTTLRGIEEIPILRHGRVQGNQCSNRQECLHSRLRALF